MVENRIGRGRALLLKRRLPADSGWDFPSRRFENSVWPYHPGSRRQDGAILQL
ncbi:MAG: hypothetical protein RL598_914, partial [Verrucomicrobiota bacterium]